MTQFTLSETPTQETFPTIQSLAYFLCSCMETVEKESGENFTRTKDGCPEWARDLIYTSHEPNDEVYHALAHISDSDEDTDADDVIEGLEPDIYTSDLLGWLAADNSRADDVDEAVSEMGYSTLLSAIGWAQVRYREGIVREMYEALDGAGLVKKSRDDFKADLLEDLKEMGYDTEEELYAITDDFIDSLWEEKGHDRTEAADEAYNAIIEDQEAKAAQEAAAA